MSTWVRGKLVSVLRLTLRTFLCPRPLPSGAIRVLDFLILVIILAFIVQSLHAPIVTLHKAKPRLWKQRRCPRPQQLSHRLICETGIIVTVTWSCLATNTSLILRRCVDLSLSSHLIIFRAVSTILKNLMCLTIVMTPVVLPDPLFVLLAVVLAAPFAVSHDSSLVFVALRRTESTILTALARAIDAGLWLGRAISARLRLAELDVGGLK